MHSTDNCPVLMWWVTYDFENYSVKKKKKKKKKKKASKQANNQKIKRKRKGKKKLKKKKYYHNNIVRVNWYSNKSNYKPQPYLNLRR